MAARAVANWGLVVVQWEATKEAAVVTEVGMAEEASKVVMTAATAAVVVVGQGVVRVADMVVGEMEEVGVADAVGEEMEVEDLM